MSQDSEAGVYDKHLSQYYRIRQSTRRQINLRPDTSLQEQNVGHRFRGRKAVARAKHASTISFYPIYPPDEVHKMRKIIASFNEYTKLFENFGTLIEYLAPSDEAMRAHADNVVDVMCTNSESMLGIASQDMDRLVNWAGSDEPIGREAFCGCVGIMSTGVRAADGIKKEDWIYDQLISAHLFAEETAQTYKNEHLNPAVLVANRPELGNLKPFRLPLPHGKSDRMPKGADVPHRVDMMLGMSTHDQAAMPYSVTSGPTRLTPGVIISGEPVRPHTLSYLSALAIGEAKQFHTRTNKDEAYAQVIDYTRHIYANQDNRRFVWSYICCDSIVNVIRMEPDRPVSSNDMNLRTPEGRREFFRFLAYLNFCEYSKLGFDSSMESWVDNKGRQRWDIKMFEGKDELTPEEFANAPIYRTIGTAKHATSAFGTHSRSFYVKRVNSEGEMEGETFMLKDSWFNPGTQPPPPDVLAQHGLSDLSDTYSSSDEPDILAQYELSDLSGIYSSPDLPESLSQFDSSDLSVVAAPLEQLGIQTQHDSSDPSSAPSPPNQLDVLAQHRPSDSHNTSRVPRPPRDRNEVATMALIGPRPSVDEGSGDADARQECATVVSHSKVFQLCGDRVVLDDSHNFFTPNDNYNPRGPKPPYRLHQRTIASPVGMPLDTAVSGNEIVVALVDVMETIISIRRNHGIHYWDLKLSNVALQGELPTKENGNKPRRAFMHDFKHVIFPGDDPHRDTMEQTATLPFLSIRDLEDMEREYNILDTWSTMLNNICYAGTFGTGNWRLPEASKQDFPIVGWLKFKNTNEEVAADVDFLDEEFRAMAESKRRHMDSAGIFLDDILGYFNNSFPGVDALVEFAYGIRSLLHSNKITEEKGREYICGAEKLNTSFVDTNIRSVAGRGRIVKRHIDPIACQNSLEDIDEINSMLFEYAVNYREAILNEPAVPQD